MFKHENISWVTFVYPPDPQILTNIVLNFFRYRPSPVLDAIYKRKIEKVRFLPTKYENWRTVAKMTFKLGFDVRYGFYTHFYPQNTILCDQLSILAVGEADYRRKTEGPIILYIIVYYYSGSKRSWMPKLMNFALSPQSVAKHVFWAF